MGCSVLILTLNEEANLPRCLESVRWCDDIVVLDSFSTDKTVEIAKAAGARVIQRKFDNWASHQNWAVANIEFRHPWVYYSDADEVLTEELSKEIQAVTADEARAEVAYRVRYKNMFFGRWLKYSSMYPVWILRLFRPGKVRWERLVNPVPVVDGAEGRLQEHFLHYSFNKGLSAWVTKHGQYAKLEAEESIRSLREDAVPWRAIFSFDSVRRRKALKTLSFRLPFRPLLRFAYMYGLRGGFLDGRAGLIYCRLIAFYEYLIVLQMREIRQRQQGLPL